MMKRYFMTEQSTSHAEMVSDTKAVYITNILRNQQTAQHLNDGHRNIRHHTIHIAEIYPTPEVSGKTFLFK